VPGAQDCTPLDAVLAWRGAVPTAALVALLEQGFWPQWHAILAHWLAGAPDHNEVARWYLSWKSRFPQARRPSAMREGVSYRTWPVGICRSERTLGIAMCMIGLQHEERPHTRMVLHASR